MCTIGVEHFFGMNVLQKKHDVDAELALGDFYITSHDEADIKRALSWYGKGPWETYADRKDAAFTGFYTSSVAEQHVPFVVPCECGGHEDTRFAVLSDGTHTVQIVGSDDFHFSALPYSMAEYRKAAYEEELPEHTTGTWLILDAAHAGLGGDTGWTKNIHPEYRVCKGRYSYTFRFHFA